MNGRSKLIVAIDYETCDDRGASFEFFRSDFRVFSLSCAWRDDHGELKQWFSKDPERIRHKLVDLALHKHQIVAHNLPFEYGVTKHCYPKIDLNWCADTMRLSQIWDCGGDEFNPPMLSAAEELEAELNDLTEEQIRKLQYKGIGLSLEACARRILDNPVNHDHKNEAHSWLEEHHGIKSKHGQYLHLLPDDILERYNNLDTEVTLLLYEQLIQNLSNHNIEWQRDHELYFMRMGLISSAYERGIKVDLESLFGYIKQVDQEITDIENKFLYECRHALRDVQELRLNKMLDWCCDPELKKDKSRIGRLEKLFAGKFDEDWKHFNVGSNKQLEMLFCDVLKINPKFRTPKGSPSFKASHLNQWGEAGKILFTRKKRLLVLQQAMNTYLASLRDGRVHCQIKVAGTRTNRVSGGTY